ncbi:MAG: helix-turn-helix domain-containing protein [Pseudonocardiaceae bacterium]|jgi:transcriptional regulator with XRE-family HTH domain
MTIDPAWWERPDLRAALAVRDIGAVYRALADLGVSQRRIAALTGQSQSEVSEILSGRRVIAYEVLERIAEGLGIPREMMGLSWYGPGGASAYAGGVMVQPPEGVTETMRRRAFLAAAGVAIVGQPIKQLGEVLNLPGPPPAELPSRISAVHVTKVRDLTQNLLTAARVHGPDLGPSSAAVAWAVPLLDLPGPESVTRSLISAVADLHTVAGSGAFDAGLYDHTLYHYLRALELATEAGDAYLQALALTFAGLATEEHGHPNDGLKMLQLAQVKAWDIPDDQDRRNAVEATALAYSVTALARLGYHEAARAELAKSRQLWRPSTPYGDPDRVAALLEADRGRLDVAEPFAQASVRRWEGGASELGRTHSRIVLATIHVQASEPDGIGLAHGAITAVSKLSSVRARNRLEPLASALETQRSSDARELARMARRVATTRV